MNRMDFYFLGNESNIDTCTFYITLNAFIDFI